MTRQYDAEILCPKCQSICAVQLSSLEQIPKFCPFCGSQLDPSKAKTIACDSISSETPSSSSTETATLISGHQPHDDKIQFTIGSYQVLKVIGKGGMGEVFLAYDTTCGRRIALKRIRSDLMEHKQMHNRFLKEARVTSQLTHPSIIPIYAIHGQHQQVYYTMPYVEGQTLKQILRKTRQLEKIGQKSDSMGGSIPALMRIYLSICQAIAYAHSKGVLHRDVKPENIIVGHYGEVLILDWGLAKIMRPFKSKVEEEELLQGHVENPLHQITNIGKVVGTVAYMAPERAMGKPATVHSDIYSLGVILYQILTLYLPFKRGTLKDFRENMHKESLYDPTELAPYRDVPKTLSRIVLKCLSTELTQRYQTVNDLLRDVESYIEGRAEWFQISKLDIFNKADWEFQENVLIAEHIAITRGTEISDWVSLMISKSSFSENIKIEAKVRLGEKGHGLGFLLSIPEASQRTHLNDGYCLWLGSDQNRSTKLLRSTVEVLNSPDVYLQHGELTRVRIEKIDNNLYLYLNNVLQFSYISHLPLVGTHIGLLARDADFILEDFSIFVGSQSVMVKCLAVPDAFLAQKNYITALSEYRRIGYSFPGRAEGREAMFRAGITLLEQARTSSSQEEAWDLYDKALNEFEKLHGTPGAPLEYLGKALTYQALNENDEEVKCFELAFRRYPNHPLLPILKEQIVYRMHTSSRSNRLATYRFILLVLRHMEDVAGSENAKKLFASLKKHWEPLYFIQTDSVNEISDTLDNLTIGTVLAFWLAKPYVLSDIIQELVTKIPSPITPICNALYCLIELGALKLARKSLDEVKKQFSQKEHEHPLQMLEIALSYFDGASPSDCLSLISSFQGKLDFSTERTLLFLLTQAISRSDLESVHTIYAELQQKQCELSSGTALLIDCFQIWAYLLQKNWNAANEILSSYPIEQLLHDDSLLHFLYGCWLQVTEGQEITIIHFSAVLDVIHPRTWSLFNHFYNGKIDLSNGWIQKAFLWERRQLYLQLILYYECLGEPLKADYFRLKEKEERVADLE
jgi:eukaryotic-like serine/threonine-protein kinase